MSDPNTTTSGPAKPSKSAGLSLYNRFACGAAALLALATAMILVSTSQASQSARDMRDEAHATLQQAGEELAPYWCSQITPDNVKNFDDLYSLYLDVNDEVRSIVKQQCEKKVIINDLVANNTPNEAFDTTSECVIGESDSTLACTATVTANDSVKKELAAFPSTAGSHPRAMTSAKWQLSTLTAAARGRLSLRSPTTPPGEGTTRSSSRGSTRTSNAASLITLTPSPRGRRGLCLRG